MRGLLMAGALAATAAAALPAAAQPGRSCFFVNEWYSWKAADDHTIYLNVGNNRVFRVDMAGACPALTLGDSRIVSIDRSGSGQVCSPIDLDIHVSEGGGITTACIVNGMSELTPDQIAALPKNVRP
jgi:uncharacterized protein DUF6491